VSALTLAVTGVGLLGPGFASWQTSRDALRRGTPHRSVPTELPAPARLPPAERRRAGAAVKLALAVADQAVDSAALDLGTLATVFTSSSGEGAICHQLCETLASTAPMVSPTRFTNSVHNAAAGFWHIAVGSRAASTSLCAHDTSFSAGLIEAATLVHLQGRAVLLVASDSPYPQPLHAKRPLPDHFGVALLLAPHTATPALAVCSIEWLAPGAPAPVEPCADPALEALRGSIPAAAALPLLIALARGGGRVELQGPSNSRLRIELG
jgi:hypothetical protein